MADTPQPAPDENAAPTSHGSQIRDDAVLTHHQEAKQRHHHSYNEHDSYPGQANEDEDDDHAQQALISPPLQHAAEMNAAGIEPPDTDPVRKAVSRQSESDWLWSSAKQAEQERLIRCTVLDLEQQERGGFPARHGRLTEWTEEQYNIDYWHRQRQRSDDWADPTSHWEPAPGKAAETGGNNGWDSGWGDVPDYDRSYQPEDWDMPVDAVTEEEEGGGDIDHGTRGPFGTEDVLEEERSGKKASERSPVEDSGKGDHSDWR